MASFTLRTITSTSILRTAYCGCGLLNLRVTTSCSYMTGVMIQQILRLKEINVNLSINNMSVLHERYSSIQGTIASLDKNFKEKEKKIKTTEPVKIMLISETENVSIVTLEDAKKIARKRGYQLHHIDNKDGNTNHIKTDKQVYKMSAAFGNPNFLEIKKGKDGEGSSRTHKEEKTLILHAKIAEHDVLSKVRNVLKWIQKGHEVRVYIGQGGGGGDAGKGSTEGIYSLIESNVKEFGRIVQKRNKGSEIRFQIIPLPKQQPTKPSTSSLELNSEQEVDEQIPKEDLSHSEVK